MYNEHFIWRQVTASSVGSQETVVRSLHDSLLEYIHSYSTATSCQTSSQLGRLHEGQVHSHVSSFMVQSVFHYSTAVRTSNSINLGGRRMLIPHRLLTYKPFETRPKRRYHYLASRQTCCCLLTIPFHT